MSDIVVNVVSAAAGLSMIVYALHVLHKWSKLADRIGSQCDLVDEKYDQDGGESDGDPVS